MIYYDLEKSPYIFKKNGINFHFSSKFYLEKFKKEYENYIDIEMYRFYQRYKLKLEKHFFTNFLLVSFYKKVEKRGFCIITDDYTILDDYFI